MVKDIVLFYYYSSLSLPDECFLNLSKKIAYRNMFLFRCPQNKIHFEFPMFEDHTYNSICNTKGVKSLIKRPKTNEKYIIFRTYNYDIKKNIIIGYYKVMKEYFQETKMFNNSGFIWGIEAGETHLIEKNKIIYNGPKITRGYRVSWKSKKWENILNDLLRQIKQEKDISDLYKKETNRLISFFKSPSNIKKWRNQCKKCFVKNKCTLNRRYTRYNNSHNCDMYSVLYKIYTSNIYSRNILNKIPKRYIN
ncbi:MAG: hypothetical protein ACTSRP_13045 [Candidatus Helarchaeota archaeon]